MIKRIATAIATGALLVNAATPFALASTTLQISGNGSDSDSTVNLTTTNNTVVTQSNNADVKNNVTVDGDTGGNDANDNTGGDVAIDTGDVTSNVAVSNVVNSNTASVDCCETAGDTDVLISGNGTHSNNDVTLDQSNGTEIYQANDADIYNDIDVDGDSGDNDAEDNTGGDVSVKTGDVDASVTVVNAGNANVAQVGGGHGDEEGGSLSVQILGNGSDSDNTVDLTLEDGILLVQENEADVDNKVKVDSDTGDNDANDNTGGEVLIDTGDVKVDVDVENMLNFNWADADCGCLLDDVLAKISGNGTDSNNDITAELGSATEVFQDNCGGEQLWEYSWYGSDCEVDNDVDVDSDTGDNDAEDNTVGDEEDPTVETGDVDADIDLSTSGNVNVYGAESEIEIPDFDLEVSFDLNDLLELLGLV